MRSISRIYPLRKTSQAWKIPLMVTHTCNDSCKYKLSKISMAYRHIEGETLDSNDGNCPFNNKKIPTSIRIKHFKIDDPVIGADTLHNPDEIVIPDVKFDVIMRYPLRHPVKIAMYAPSEKGFTRVQLIDSLQKIYEFLYREEERTATPTVYEYRVDCHACSNKNPRSFLRQVRLKNTCSICYSRRAKKGVKLPCGHCFHKPCILSWLKDNNTCPLCRQYVVKCEVCQGLGFISHTQENVVIPLELRGSYRNRNTTDGIFGIWGHDFEDLYLERLFYHHKKKSLIIGIGS